MATNEVRVDQDNGGSNDWIPDWFKRYYAGTPGGRTEEVRRPGSVPDSPVGQPEPERFGLSALIDAPFAAGRWLENLALNTSEGIGRFLTSQQQLPPGERLGDIAYGRTITQPSAELPETPQELLPAPIVPGDPRWSYEEMMAGRGTPVNPQGQTFSDMIAAQQFDGTPYDMAGDYLLERRQAQLEAVQNMYNQYAAEAAENAQRVADIYAGAESGIGETYGGAQELTESAYGSAQQQAADQLARLGIEEAAPAVVNPMALSQAEAMSNLAANQAAGTGAVQRFGATSGDFASQMAQVAQQQAVEQQDRFTSQLADQLFEIEMQRAQAQAAFNPYERAIQQLQAEQAFNQFYNPQPDTQQEFERAMEVADAQRFAQQSLQDTVLELLPLYDNDLNLATEAARNLQIWAQQQLATQ